MNIENYTLAEALNLQATINEKIRNKQNEINELYEEYVNITEQIENTFIEVFTNETNDNPGKEGGDRDYQGYH